MLSAWAASGFYISQELQRVFPIRLTSSSESDDSFPGQFFVTDSSETQVSYMCSCAVL